MRNGFDPSRRNRNIGTAKQGVGRDNRMRIPATCHHERVWWEQIDKYRVLRRRVEGRDVLFIVEDTTEGFVHTCSVGDLCRILSLVPPDDWEGLQTFVLRQPTSTTMLSLFLSERRKT